MSNPADNSEGCEVCGLDRQVLGCRPGKCKNEKAPPLGYAKCPKPGCPRWMGPGRVWNGQPDKGSCWTCLNLGFTDDEVLEPDWTPPVAPVEDHPLPWRWEKDSYEPADGCWGSMVDARGEKLIGPTNLDGILSVTDEYVRAVTERGGAMEQALRRMVERAFLRMADGDLGRCIYCASIGGPPQARHYPECPAPAAATILAEIDAAKAGG